MEKRGLRANQPVAPLSNAKLGRELLFYRLFPLAPILYRTLAKHRRRYYAQLDKMLARIGKDSAQQIHATEKSTSKNGK
jgi:hypothetical protein